MAVLATVTAAAGYGLWRLRLPVDVAATVLAGVAFARPFRRAPSIDRPGREVVIDLSEGRRFEADADGFEVTREVDALAVAEVRRDDLHTDG